MKRFVSLFGMVAIALLTGPVALYGQAGGGAGGGGQGAGGGGQAGGQAGVAGGVQPGAQPGVQAGAQIGVQPGAQVGVQPGLQNQPGMNFGGVQQTPWFNPQLVRRALNLTDQQIEALNRSYMDYWTRYNQDMRTLGRNLSDQQRMQRLRELEGNFQQQFNAAANNTITEPRQRQRFNQLGFQYRGLAAFNDPFVLQQLNLTPQQRQQITLLHNAWNTEMARAGTEFRVGDTAINSRLRELRRLYDQRLSAILNDQQRQAWGALVGEPFEFPADVFFQTENNNRNDPRVNANPGTPVPRPVNAPPVPPNTTPPQTTAPQVPQTTAPQIPQTTAPQVPSTPAPDVPPETNPR